MARHVKPALCRWSYRACTLGAPGAAPAERSDVRPNAEDLHNIFETPGDLTVRQGAEPLRQKAQADAVALATTTA